MKVQAERNRDEEAIKYLKMLAEELKIQSTTTNIPENSLFPKINSAVNNKVEEQANKYQHNLKKIRQFIQDKHTFY